MTEHTGACQCEPVGALELSVRLGLRPNTIAKYRFDGILPEARWFVSGKPAWCFAEDIEPWLAQRRPYHKKET